MNTREMWINHSVAAFSNIYWYFAIELGFYMSLLVSQFTDVKRKDFWQLFVHHIITISLLMFSYLCNFHRVGSLVLLLHDCADYWLELAKMALYAKLAKLCDPLFIIFTVVWFLTRLLLFPFK